MREREAFQEIDYRAVFGTMAKWATEIDDPARIPEIVSRAFYTATNGRPGPVVIALPEDMLTERVAVPMRRASSRSRPGRASTDMMRLQKLLWAAERPVVLLGGSRWSTAACAALVRFAERFALPVATTFRRGHLFDALHPCYAGDLGIGPNPKLLARIKAPTWSAGRRPARRVAVAELHAVRHPGAAPDLRACASRRGGARPGLSPAPCDPRRADRLLPPRSRACSRPTRFLARANARPRMTIISPGPTSRRSSRARVNLGEIMVWLRDQLPPDAFICNGAGNFAGLDAPLLSLPPLRHPCRADLGLDGLRPAGRGRDEAALSAIARWSALPATATS